jgi:2-oxoglutarate ferredoxin oxidoreductase subunit delta
MIIMLYLNGIVNIDIERCKGCELCINNCRFNVLKMANKSNSNGYRYPFVTNPSICIGCTYCALGCPDVAIIIFKQKISIWKLPYKIYIVTRSYIRKKVIKLF